MRVEFTVSMEGPKLSRRPGQCDVVDDREAIRLLARNMAIPVDADNKRLDDPVFDDKDVETEWRAEQAWSAEHPGETRPADPGEKAVTPTPPRTNKPVPTEQRKA